MPSVLWSNGIYQNIIYLAQCLKQIDNVDVFLLAYPFDNMPIHPVGASFNIPTINTHAAALTLDAIIELGIRIEKDFAEPYRDGGGKLISYMAGNAMVMNFESVFLPTLVSKNITGLAPEITDLKPGGAERGSVISGSRFDAVWITPQHWHMNGAYAKAMLGPARVAPHIWSPLAIEHAIQSLGVDPRWKERPKAWSLGTFDPNINVVKSFHFPLLVANEAHKQEPDAIRRMMLFCTQHLCGRPHFESFVGHLDLPTSKITAEGRHGVVAMLGREVDCVITHQWENDLNYLYWDTLYLGYPLVHNSEALGQAGYYYDSFDPESGGHALLRAMRDHNGPTEQDMAATWRHHATNPENVAKYEFLLDEALRHL